MIGTKIYKPIDEEQYKIVADWCNETQLGYIEDKGEYYECCAIPEPTEAEIIIDEVNQLKQYLNDTDWAVVKCYDLELVFKEQYPDLYEKRKQARLRINELEN